MAHSVIESRHLRKMDLPAVCSSTTFVDCVFGEDCQDIKFVECRFCGCQGHNQLTMHLCWVFDEYDTLVHQITGNLDRLEAENLSPQAHMLSVNFKALFDALKKYQYRVK